MKKIDFKLFLLILFICLIFYSDSFSHYFYQDDFYHFFISRISSIGEFIDFFNPISKFEYQVYRPLSTQVFFFFYQSLFGFHHFPFQFIVLTLLSFNSFLIFKLCKKYTSSTLAFLLSLFYLFHHQNIGIVYYLSTIQTTFVVLLTLLSLIQIQNKRKHWKTKIFIFYLLSLLCHEISIVNSVIFSSILIFDNIKNIKKEKKLILSLISLSVIFFIFRLYFINSQFFENTHYSISLSPKTILNSLMWYVLWLFSVPEYVINFIGSGFRPLPPLFNQYKSQSITSFVILITNLAIFSFFTIRSRFKKKILIYLSYFFISLTPILLFPWHKYTYYLPVASIFIVIAIAMIIGKSKNSRIYYLLISILTISAIITNFIDRSTSYNFNRGQMSKNIIFNLDFDTISNTKKILIANDPDFQVFSDHWGSTSSQAKIVLRDQIGLQLLSENSDLIIDYQDDLEINFDLSNYDYQFIIKKEWQ